MLHDTTENWNALRGFIPIAGEIIVFDDWKEEIVDGKKRWKPGIKIGKAVWNLGTSHFNKSQVWWFLALTVNEILTEFRYSFL